MIETILTYAAMYAAVYALLCLAVCAVCVIVVAWVWVKVIIKIWSEKEKMIKCKKHQSGGKEKWE